MPWFHTVVLTALTALAVQKKFQKNGFTWRLGAVVLGYVLIVIGLWIDGGDMSLLLVGAVVAALAIEPRRIAIRHRNSDANSLGEGHGMAKAHVVLAKTRFLLNDVQLVLLLDGNTVYEGGFKSGVDLWLLATPGEHRIEVVREFPTNKIRNSWVMTVPDAGCEVVLKYSRFSASFEENISVMPPTMPGASSAFALHEP